MTKLSWKYDDAEGHEIAWHNGYRISAKRDVGAENPFEKWDGNWPIAVYYSGQIETYDKTKAGAWPADALQRFTDEQLVHNQKAIASALQTSIPSLAIDYLGAYDRDEPPPSYMHSADDLRDAFGRELDNISTSDRLALASELYGILGIPSLLYHSRGYCQGDWAEVLIVATPEACEEFGLEKPLLGVGPDAHIEAFWEDRLKSTGDLYSAWAWGDVYGYVIEFAVYDEDGEIEDWEEVPDGSCWGYYGDDHAESGLEEAALECVPDEPAPAAPDPETCRLSADLECV